KCPKISELFLTAYKPVLGSTEDSRQQSCIETINVLLRGEGQGGILNDFRSLQETITNILQLLYNLNKHEADGASEEDLDPMRGSLKTLISNAQALIGPLEKKVQSKLDHDEDYSANKELVETLFDLTKNSLIELNKAAVGKTKPKLD